MRVCLALTVLLAACSGSLPAEDAATPDGNSRCSADVDCDDGRFCNGAERCVPDSDAADARGCVPAAAPCPAAMCDEEADGCGGDCTNPDADGDGVARVACGGTDCDDEDANRFPGNPEVCDGDAHDEDCDPTTVGARDLDGDLAHDAACCNVDGSGSMICGRDCDDTQASISPVAAELCNGVDDDCDGIIDDILDGVVFCASGASAPCFTACGVAGTRACRADCLAYEASCVAAEECNGCDDDADGARDEGFECVLGVPRVCTTACGTTGIQDCTGECTLTACVTPVETCNYCDDNGAGGFADERVLASDTLISVLSDHAPPTGPNVGTRTAGAATVTAEPNGPPGEFDLVAQLLDGEADTQAGAYWVDLDRRIGWGPTTIDVEMRVRTVAGGSPVGGWSVVVSTGGSGDVGEASDFGVPRGHQGVRFDWTWMRISSMTGDLSPGDAVGYALMNGTTFERRGSSFSGDLFQDLSPGADFDGETSEVVQRMQIVYTPENPYTTASDERVEIRVLGGTAGVWEPDGSVFTTDPANDLPIGSTIRVAITAGTRPYTYRPSGAPADITVGARVIAKVRVRHFIPPNSTGTTEARWEDLSTIERQTICPGL